ncbi:MAG: MarR family transcriptional regulator [Defluviitaleaceae bacterium]|nr:MarR family transcriptional regulator [Defluviitaleaceae bacterium]
MNIKLFTTQLNQFLQTNTDPDLLEGVCDLLRVHTSASIYVRGRDGNVLTEVLSESDVVGEEYKVGCITLRREEEFTEDEKLAASIALCVCTVLIRHREEAVVAEKQRRAKAVRSIINSLSFSELEAATQILAALKNNEGLLIAGHIADKLGVARSVVTGALRKLEGANLIETRSLGMKGTYIRVKNTLLTEELAKL